MGSLPGLEPGSPGLTPGIHGVVGDAQHSPLIYAHSSHDVPSAKAHIPTWLPSEEVTSVSVHQFFSQFTEAGLARPADHVESLLYWLHFGSPGVSQYIRVQASGLPSLTEQLLQPSK